MLVWMLTKLEFCLQNSLSPLNFFSPLQKNKTTPHIVKKAKSHVLCDKPGHNLYIP